MIIYNFLYSWGKEEAENIQYHIKDDYDEKMILDFIEKPTGRWLKLVGDQRTIHLDFNQVKSIIREESANSELKSSEGVHLEK